MSHILQQGLYVFNPYLPFDCNIEDSITSRKSALPFTDVEDMYSKTPFRLAMIPDTSYVDNFKYSPDPMWQSIYSERIEPNLQESTPIIYLI